MEQCVRGLSGVVACRVPPPADASEGCPPVQEFAPNGSGELKNASFETLETTPHNYKLVDNEADMRKLCDFFRTNEILSLDTETTSKSAIDAELVGLSFAVNRVNA